MNMVMLLENVRNLSRESNLIDNGTDYTLTSSGWATLHDYGNIALYNELNLVVFSVKFSVGGSQRYARLKIGSYYVWGKNDVAIATYTGIACLPSGLYDVLLEGRDDSGGSVTVDRLQVGKAFLSDATGYGLTSYASAITLRTPARNNLPCGPLKNAMFMVRVWASTGGAQTNFENPGDSLTNGVSLAVDGVQVSWSVRDQDAGSIGNACATYYGSLSVVASHTFTISKDNGGTTVHITVYVNPWLLGNATHEPVTLCFAERSTLYVTMEPLDADPTKTGKLGKTRAVTFGAATDFYDTQSGTGIKVFSHTFTDLKPSETMFLVDGLGGCISNIGVDAV